MNDLISRQSVKNWLAKWEGYIDHDLIARMQCRVIDIPSAQPEQRWIPCSERLPERIINGDVETVQEFFVTVKERWPGGEWIYNTDVAEFPGDYIDDIWQTWNDWREGQEVHVIAWIPLPEPYKEDNNERPYKQTGGN